MVTYHNPAHNAAMLSRTNTSDRFSVAVRVRPPLPQEVSKNGSFHSCLEVDHEDKETAESSLDNGNFTARTITCSGNAHAMMVRSKGRTDDPSDSTAHVSNELEDKKIHRFSFDCVLPPTASQTLVFDTCVSPAVESVLSGVNATVFAYGQTGSGKTHTIYGNGEGELAGVVHRSLKSIFSATRDMESHSQVSAELSFLEIYRETITDLLACPPSPSAQSNKLKLRQSDSFGEEEGEVYVDGATRVTVESFEQAMSLIRGGLKRRVTSAAWHEHSSRSHAIVTIKVTTTTTNVTESLPVGADAVADVGGNMNANADVCMEEAITRTAKLHLVDLAGSENVTTSGVTGDGLREACSINLSLTNLSRVITALINRQKKEAKGKGTNRVKAKEGKGKSKTYDNRTADDFVHVPYRDSKLTYLLKDSLGGNNRTTLIATLSPSFDSFAHTLGSLKFARCCTTVRNKVQVNERKSIVPKKDKKSTVKDERDNAVAKAKKLLQGRSDAMQGRLNYECRPLMLDAGRVWVTIVTALGGGDYSTSGGDGGDVAVILHSSGVKAPDEGATTHNASECETCHYWDYLHSPILASGYRAIVIPHFPRMSSKSSFLGDNMGPMALVRQLIGCFPRPPIALPPSNVTLIGYDWGASVCVWWAVCGPPSRKDDSFPVTRTSAFHPTVSVDVFRRGEKGKGEGPTPARGGNAKTQLVWVPADQFHSLKEGKKLLSVIPNCHFDTLSVGPFNSKKSKNVYKMYKSDVVHSILAFLRPELGLVKSENHDSKSGSTDAGPIRIVAPSEEVVDSSGRVVKMYKKVAIDYGEGAADGKECSDSKLNRPTVYRPVDVEAEAVKEFKLLFEKGKIEDWMVAACAGVSRTDNSTDLSAAASSLFSKLPYIDPLTEDPSFFVSKGLWSREPQGWSAMVKSNRYYTGRYVMVRAPVLTHPCTEETFLTLAKEVGEAAMDHASQEGRRVIPLKTLNKLAKTLGFTESFVTHKCRIAPCVEGVCGVETDETHGNRSFVVAIPIENGKECLVEVPRKDIYKVNHAHQFSFEPPLSSSDSKAKKTHRTLLLEDGVKCRYKSKLMKAKLCLMALTMDKVVQQMDFTHSVAAVNASVDGIRDGSNPTAMASSVSPLASSADQSICKLQTQQAECIELVRGCMNITRLQDGVDPSRSKATRSCEVPQMITFGQSHCHGLSGSAAACLLPFAASLGLDIRYRGGDVLPEPIVVDSVKRSKNGANRTFATTRSVRNTVEKHQWLEIGFRPSMSTFVCDLSFLDGRVEDVNKYFSNVGAEGGDCSGAKDGPPLSDLHLPIHLAYSIKGRTYPNGELILGCTV